jgi:hypothetical protein
MRKMRPPKLKENLRLLKRLSFLLLLPNRAVRVLNTHVGFLEASSSSEGNTVDTEDDDDVAAVADSNVEG